jgi:Outer membrane protein beta-barrel domain
LMNPSTRNRVRFERCFSLRARRIAVWTVALLISVAADARAQIGVGAFKGALTGHIGAVTGGEISDARATLGVSVAVHEDNGWGAEIDFGHTADALSGRQILDVTTYMVNATWARPDGLFRPFGVAGAGVLQVNGCDSPCNRAARTYDLGFNAGAGTYFVVNDYAALRADMRYFFSGGDHPDLGRPDSFNYWRISFGASFTWAIAP